MLTPKRAPQQLKLLPFKRSSKSATCKTAQGLVAFQGWGQGAPGTPEVHTQLWKSFCSSQNRNSEGERNAVNHLCLQKTKGRMGRAERAQVLPGQPLIPKPLRKELDQHSVIYDHKYLQTQTTRVCCENIPWKSLWISNYQNAALPTVTSKNISHHVKSHISISEGWI